VLVLNNNCSIGPRRNLFLDELERNPRYRGMTAKQRQAKADFLEQSILDFVASGKGLVAIHGAPTMLNNSAQFTEMIGAAFDYHPSNQELSSARSTLITRWWRHSAARSRSFTAMSRIASMAL